MKAESIGNCVKRLLTANVDALVSALEIRAPHAVLEQYLLEFDVAIEHVRVDLGKYEAARHHAGKAMTRIGSEIEIVSGQITAALVGGDETAARAAAARRIDLEDQIGEYSRALRQAAKQADAAQSDLLYLSAKRSEVEMALRDAIAACAVRRRPTRSDAASSTSAAACIERIEHGFNRKFADVAGAATRHLEGQPSGESSLLQRLEALHKDQRIDECMARLKAANVRPAGESS